MGITKVINDAVDLNQTSDYSGLRLPVGTTADVTETFATDYLIVAGGGGGGTGITASQIGTGGGGGAGGLRTSFNNSTTTTNSLSFPAGKTAIATYMLNGDAADVSENYDGTATNVSYNTGIYGGAAVFNGSSSYITTPSVIPTNNFSFSFWINMSSFPGSSTNQQVFTQNENNNRWYIAVYESGRIQAWNGSGTFSTSSSVINLNQWHNVVYTASSSTGKKIYVDGIEVLTDADTGNNQGSASGTLFIGFGKWYTNSLYLDGKLDQVRIYNSVLSALDASNIYNNEVQADSGGGSAAESSLTLTEGTSYTVTIGDGGVGGVSAGASPTNGSDSVFSTITSTGGGAGGNYRNPTSSAYYAQVGGSGGGAAYTGGLQPGAAGTIGQGYQGGDDLGNSGSPAYGHGGGGGAAARGVDGGGTGSGAGGSGLALSITGTSTTYGGGGGGGGINPYPAGAGGSGGGGAGGYGNGNPGYAGAANTGGGGGGGGKTSASGTYPGNGAAGGSGIVILRYPTASVSSFTTTGTLNTPSTTDTVANNNYPVTNTAYYTLDGNANGYLTTNDLGTFDYPSGAGTVALYEMNGNANGYLTTNDLNTVNYPAGAGCIALYELNGNAADTSNTYNGSATDVTYNTGAFDQAAVFNGSSSNINIGGNIVNSLTKLSVSMWVYWDGTNSGSDDYFIALGKASSGKIFSADITNSTGIIGFYDGASVLNSTTAVSANTWTHIAITADATVLKIYLNGSLDSTHTISSLNFDSSSNVGFIGSWITGTDYEFDGLIDQVRIFNTELTQLQVTTLARGAGSAYNGAENSITYDTGAFDQAALFNGSSSYISFPSPYSHTSNTDNITVSWWMNGDTAFSNGSFWGILGGEIANSSGNAGTININAYGKGTNQAYIALTRVWGSSARYHASSSTSSSDWVTMIPGQWYHNVITYDPATNSSKYYLDNTLIYNITFSTYTTSGNATNGTLAWGKYRNGNSYFGGKIDQARFFNTIISAAEVTTLARGAGTAYNGAESNITWQNGRFNKAALFNGSNSEITINNFVTLNQVGISMWVNIVDVTSSYGLITKYASNDREFSIYNYQASNGFIAALYYNGNNSNAITITASDYLTNNTWHHIAYTADGVNKPRLYIDGAEVSSAPTNNNTYYSTSQPISLGSFAGSASYFFDGQIDQVRIFSTALSESQAVELYNEHYQTKFTDGSDTAIVFTEGSGTITFDGTNPPPPQGAVRTNTSFSENGSASAIEHYNGTEWKQFDATKYCTTNTLNFPAGAGCIASYNLDNNVDDIGNTYNGANNNVTFNASGKFGACGVFNGSNGYIDLGTSIASSTRGVSIWVNADDFSERWPFQQGDGQGVENYIRFYNTDDIQVRWGNVTQTFSGYSANTWIHIFAQKDENDNANVWINGVEMGSTGTPSAIAVNKTHLGVRNNGGTLQYYFKGKIDQVRLFNTALTSTQIDELYTNEIACS